MRQWRAHPEMSYWVSHVPLDQHGGARPVLMTCTANHMVPCRVATPPSGMVQQPGTNKIRTPVTLYYILILSMMMTTRRMMKKKKMMTMIMMMMVVMMIMMMMMMMMMMMSTVS